MAFDPYHKWLGIPAAEQPPTHYRLLAIGVFENDPDVIEAAADQRMAHVRNFQAGPHSALSQKLLNELAAAKLCLLDPKSRQAYDDELRRRLSPAPVPVPVAAPAVLTPGPPVVPVHSPAPQAPSFEFVVERSPRAGHLRKPRLRPAAHAWLLLAAVAIPGAIFLGYLLLTKRGDAVADAIEIPGPAAVGDQASSDGFVPLFNGKDLTGWKTHPSQSGHWKVENAILKGGGTATSYLVTERGNFTNFHLRVEARINDGGDSGVYCRASLGGELFPDGYEAQINASEQGELTGGLYGRRQAGPLVRVADSPVRAGEWFTLETIVSDNHIVVKVNGRTTADYLDAARRFSTGHIALEKFRRQTEVEFRKIEIRENPPAGEIPNSLASRPVKEPELPAAAAAQDGLAAMLNGAERPSLLGVVAEKLVLHNAHFNIAGTLECKVKLLRGGREVWAKQAVAIPWAPDKDHSVALPLPPERFERVRVEITKWEKVAGGLAEIQVIDSDGRNLALGCPALASSSLRDRFSADHVTDGVTTATEVDLGAWYLPQRTAGWIEVDLSLPRPKELEGVTADKLVIWNQHNGPHNNHGTLECNVQLDSQGQEVWTRPALAVPWSPGEDHSVKIDLPAKRFDRVRVEITKWHGQSGGLAEIQVLSAEGRNLALDCPAAANGIADYARSGRRVTDGITSSQTDSVGYWLLPEKRRGWVEVDLACLDPNYGAACRQLGLALALVEGDWQRGLLWLARGDAPKLRRLAFADSQEVYDTAEQLALGDAWWDLAQQATDPVKNRLLARSMWRYRQALGKLSGFRKSEVQARIDQTLPGLMERDFLYFMSETELRKLGPWGGSLRETPVSVDGVRSFYGLWLHPESNKSSLVAFHIGKRYRRFHGAAAMNDSAAGSAASPLTFRVVGDGRELWKSRPLKDGGSSQPFDVVLTGIDKLELFVDCPGADRSCHAVWVEPRLELESPDVEHAGIPTSARSAEPPAASSKAESVSASKRFPFEIPDPRRGKWSIEGDELVQSSPEHNAMIVFGQPDWHDFDFLVEVQPINQIDGCCLLFRRQNDRNRYGVSFGGWGNTAHNASVWKDGRVKDLAYTKGALRTGKWHRLELKMRGNNAKCFLDGAQVMAFDVDPQTEGRLGLYTFAAYRFRNIQVKSPDGAVLLEGLPDLDGDSAAPATAAGDKRGKKQRFPIEVRGGMGGDWGIEGDELVRRPDLPEGTILFGDPAWTDYDFSFDAKVQKGWSASFLFGYQDEKNFHWYGIGAWDNTWELVVTMQGGKWGKRQCERNVAIPGGTWQQIRISVRGEKGKCFRNCKLVGEFSMPHLLKGRVGFVTEKKASYRFRNIVVKSPNGKVLLQGLPDIAEASVPDSKPAETKKRRTLGDLADDEKANGNKLTATEAFSLKRHEGAVTRLAFHRTRPLLASAGKDGRVLLWDLQTRAPLELHKFGEEVWAVKFHPDGEFLAFANRNWWGSRLFFKTLAGQQLNEIKDFKNPGGEVTTIAYSHDGRLLAAGQVNGTIRLWDGAQFREITPVAFGDGHNIYGLAFGTATIDRKSKRTVYRLAAGGQDGLVRILMAIVDNTNGQWTFPPSNVQFPMGGAVFGVRFSPKGNLLGCTHSGGRISLCDPNSGKLIRDLAGGGGSVEWIAFHPQRPWCITAHKNEQAARIWNAERGELLCELKGHSAGVMCAEFSPDGRHVATASEDLSIKLWKLAGVDVPAEPSGKKKTKPVVPLVGD